MVILHPTQQIILPGLTLGVEAVSGLGGNAANAQGGQGQDKHGGRHPGEETFFHMQPAFLFFQLLSQFAAQRHHPLMSPRPHAPGRVPRTAGGALPLFVADHRVPPYFRAPGGMIRP